VVLTGNDTTERRFAVFSPLVVVGTNKTHTLSIYLLIVAIYASFSVTPTAVAQQDSLTPELRKKITESLREAHEKAQEKAHKAELELNLRKLADHGDNANQYLYMVRLQSMNLSPSEGIPVFTGLLSNESDVVKQGALQSLAEYGPKAKEAVPAILKLVDDPEREWFVTGEAALALARIAGPDRKAADALLRKLGKPNLPDDINKRIIKALGIIGPKAKDSIGTLKDFMVENNNSEIQFAAYCAIGSIHDGKRLSLADLRSLPKVAWEKPEEGYPAFQAAEREGRRAVVLIPPLVELLKKDPPAYLKALAIQSIGFTGGGGNRDLVKPLIDSTASADPFLARVSEEAFDRIDTSLAPAFDLFADALAHSNPAVRHHAALALRRFGPKASKATGQLVEALRRADGKTKLDEIGDDLDALKAVSKGTPDSAAESKRLVDLLAERSKLYKGREEQEVHYLRAYILAVIAELGAPESALPYILDELSKEDSTHAHGFTAAAKAAGSLGAEAKPAVKSLVRALRPAFHDRAVSFEHFYAGQYGGPGMTTARLEAVRALHKIGPAARDVLPLLKAFAAETKVPMGIEGEYFLTAQEEARKTIKDLEDH
jgi:HEAT repeat protein